jgi:Domain of unknown function (DUF3471)
MPLAGGATEPPIHDPCRSLVGQPTPSGFRMSRRALLVLSLSFPAALAAQSPAPRANPNAVMIEFERFADIFGSRLVAAFDSIPAAQYGYRPTAAQQTVGYIAQHLEDANYSLCQRLGTARHSPTARDSLADTVKARWPKDTLVRRLEASLRFCDTALEQVGTLTSAQHASLLLAFETDLAEHYSQIATYMRLLGLVPPSALPVKQRTSIQLAATVLSRYVGRYEVAAGLEFMITMRDGGLFIASSQGGTAVRLWPESETEFFVKEVDAQVSFTKDPRGVMTGFVLHQYGRHRPAKKVGTPAPTDRREPLREPDEHPASC